MARINVMGANLTVAGKSMLDKLESVSVPVPQVVTEEFDGAGLPMKIDVKLGKVEVLKSTFTIVGLDSDLQKQMSIFPNQDVDFIINGYALDDVGAQTNVVCTMRGFLKATEGDAIAGSTLAKTNYEISCRYYKYEENGEKIHEIDNSNAVMIIGGVDLRPGMKEGLGL